jgi:hypothetical protein
MARTKRKRNKKIGMDSLPSKLYNGKTRNFELPKKRFWRWKPLN